MFLFSIVFCMKIRLKWQKKVTRVDQNPAEALTALPSKTVVDIFMRPGCTFPKFDLDIKSVGLVWGSAANALPKTSNNMPLPEQKVIEQNIKARTLWPPSLMRCMLLHF
jgi:hypothetical protein